MGGTFVWCWFQAAWFLRCVAAIIFANLIQYLWLLRLSIYLLFTNYRCLHGRTNSRVCAEEWFCENALIALVYALYKRMRAFYAHTRVKRT